LILQLKHSPIAIAKGLIEKLAPVMNALQRKKEETEERRKQKQNLKIGGERGESFKIILKYKNK
jgi:hypothetical protein